MFWRRRFPRLHKDFHITYRMVDQEKFENDPIKSLGVKYQWWRGMFRGDR